MTVAVVTDGACALDPELAEDWGVHVVPLTITLDGRAYPDEAGSDRELRAAAARPAGVGTAGPPPAAFLSALAGNTCGAVVVTVSATLSSTHRAAMLAAQLAPVPVRVVDSGTAAGAQALVARAAALVARRGGGLDAAAAAAERAAGEVRLIGCLPSLAHLARSGRVPEIVGRVGDRLGVQPMFQLTRGSVRPLRPARSMEAALDRMVEEFRQGRRQGARPSVIALHARSPQVARRLLAAARAISDPEIAVVSTFGSALVAHAGPDVVGLAWRWGTDAGEARP